jgi:hypothetical protein
VRAGSEPVDGIFHVPVDPVARIVLPLNLMRNVIALLQLQIESYQASFGEIPDHPNKPPWLQEAEALEGNDHD